MKKGNLFFCFAVLSIFLSSFASAQEQLETGTLIPESRLNRIASTVEEMVLYHKYRFGFLRMRPTLQALTGYDSNAVVLNNEYIGDYYAVATPGASFGFRLGRRAYLRLIEELTFLYYKDQEQRRDIFSTTRGEFYTGSRRLLLKTYGGYRKSKMPLDDELDVPVDQSITDAGYEAEYTLTTRVDLRSTFNYLITNLEFDEEVNDLELQLFDRRSTLIGAGIDYNLKRTIAITGDFYLGHSETIDTDVTTDYWAALGGLQFSARRMHGRAQVGGGRSESEQGDNNDHFLTDFRLDFIFGKAAILGGFFRREYRFSAFVEDTVVVTTEGGARFNVPIGDRLNLNSTYTIGKHDYDDALINGVVIEKDNFQRLDFFLDYRIVQNLFLRSGVQYINRNTDIPGLRKEEFIYAVGLSYSLN